MTASLSANSAVPLYRKRPVCDDAGATKQAAGTLFVAPDGDVLLLRRSSAEANFAGHWALPGGGVDDGETPEVAADRESSEEMGMAPEGARKLLDKRRTPTGSVFTTFVRAVPEKFVPKLNDEHSGYAWAPLDVLPGPIHPAVDATLRERVGVAKDMTPEDWQSLRDGFVKWTAEEEQEGEHAEDDDIRDLEPGSRSYVPNELAMSKAMSGNALDHGLALDRDSVRSFDGDGRMRVATTNLSKATVNPYRGKEIPGWDQMGLDPDKIYQLLRDPDELKKAASTFNGVQLLRKHIPVNAEDHQPWDVVGTTGTEAKYEHPYLKNSLHVWHQDAIDEIESDAKRELSCGYHYRPDMTPGDFDGMRYDGVMRDIRGNHVALVKDGRAGPDVLVGDSMENLMAKPTRLAAFTLSTIASHIAPMLALDASVSIDRKLFDGLSSKTMASSKKKLLDGIRPALDGKLRKGLALDASMEHIGKVMDNVAGMFEGGSQSVDSDATEAQAKMMEAAAGGKSEIEIPKPAGEEYVQKDAAALGDFLKSKGMGADDIKTACDMWPKPATDSEEEESEEDNDGNRKVAAVDEEKEKMKKEIEAKDAEMKDMVKKPAMDSAIADAVKAERKNATEVRQAVDFVRPWVGALRADLAMDTAEQVYRHAAEALGLPDAKTVHGSALRSMISMARKPGDGPQARQGQHIALDEDTRSEAAKVAPGIEHIQIGPA